tara:strand:+ start:832 stop:1044 length:213 start_codon:yes stop_codon:yes gene_type:complete
MDSRILKQHKINQEKKERERRVQDRLNQNFNVSQQYHDITNMRDSLKKVRQSKVTHSQSFLSGTGSTRNT